jgi:hypothetical protein
MPTGWLRPAGRAAAELGRSADHLDPIEAGIDALALAAVEIALSSATVLRRRPGS